MKVRVSALLCVIAIWATPASAAGTSDKPRINARGALDALIDCSEIENGVERLGCFDRNAAEARSARKDNGDWFQAEQKSSPEAFKEIESTIASIASLRGTAWLIVLADGSIWRTTDVIRNDPVVGDAVRITKGALGSFLARIGDVAGVRVRRLR